MPPRKQQASRPRKPRAARPVADGPVLDESVVAALESLHGEIRRSFVLTAERVQETFEDGVRRGCLTRSDAERLVATLLDVGHSQRKELLADLEAVVDRATTGVADGLRRARDGVDATVRRSPMADRALRVAGFGSLPIKAYDELVVGQVLSKLESLSAAELRRVQTYERSHANRKSVLAAIEKRLG